MKFARISLISLICLGVVLCSSMPALVYAQPSPPPALWFPADNVSNSGGASIAQLALSPDDVAYAAWWDAAEGLRYSVGRVTSQTVEWTSPRSAASINGGQDLRDPLRPVMLAPQRTLLLGGPSGAHYLFYDKDDRLLYARITRTKVDLPQLVAVDAAGAAASVDMSGTLHVVYAVGSTDAKKAGIYYHNRRSTVPMNSTIALSSYLRGAAVGDVQLSVAADPAGRLVVAWRQRAEPRGFYASSDDGGRTWSDPQEIAPRSGLLGAQSFVSVSFTPQGEFLLLWRDVAAAGCGLVQRRSSDGGMTWGVPQRVLEDASPCPAEWRTASRADALWLLGAPQGGAMLLTAWDGRSWSRLGVVRMTSLQPTNTAGALLGYSCLSAAFGGRHLAIIGCDSRGDVFVALSSGPVEEFASDAERRWSDYRPLSVFGSPPHALASAQGADGEAFVAWTNGRALDDDGEHALMLSSWADDGWRSAATVLQLDMTGSSDGSAVALQHPSVALVGHRLHAVWQGGRSGRVFYSSAALRDAALREGWSAPIPLPAVSAVGGAPALVEDPWSGALLVMYPVSYNEGRGIYLVRSDDDGATWQSAHRVIDASDWTAVDDVQLAVDLHTGEWHALFLQLDAADGTGRRILRHMSSRDGGTTWMLSTAPLADGDVSTPRLGTMGDGRVTVVWNRLRPTQGAASPAAPFETWTRTSRDGGRSWTVRARVPGFGAVSGALALATDAAGRAVLGAVGATPEQSAVLLTSEMDESGWRSAEASALNQPAAAGNTLTLLFDGRKGWIRAALRVATLQTDGTLRSQVGVLQRRMDAVAAVLITPPPPTSTPRATPRMSPTATPTVIVLAMPPAEPVASDSSPLLLGGLSAVALIGLALAVWRVRRVWR